VIVSDAILAAGLGPGHYKLCNQDVVVGEDLVPRSTVGSNFVGSATMIPRMAENLRRFLGLSDEEVLQLTEVGPRRILSGDQQI
jgi:N-acetylglucosamine-6-phosphate deacetylase